MLNRLKCHVMGVVLASVLPAMAGAEPTFVKSTHADVYGNPPVYSGFATIEDGTQNDFRTAGGFHVSSDVLGNVVAFCIELPQALILPHTYDLAATPLSAEDTDALSRLFTGYFAQIDSSVETAAFQSAVWEIVNDDTYDLNDGRYQQLSNPAVKVLATGYLAGLSDFSADYDLEFLISPVSQDLVVGLPRSTFAGS